MKFILYITVIVLTTSCLFPKKLTKPNEQWNNTKTINSINVLGDTNFVLWDTACQYLVEDISKKIQFPDSLKELSFSQSPKAGELIERINSISVSLFFASKTKIDTFYYQVNYNCQRKFSPLYISPNGNGINDCWVVPGLKKYPKNTLKLFDRWGNLVYEKEGYMNDFCGIPNTKYGKEKAEKDGLLPGTRYFYILDIGDSKIEPYTGLLKIIK
ncbi:MAG: gliding motility-associated C-terminal domain-containing protein [Flavobacteriales bacterium]